MAELVWRSADKKRGRCPIPPEGGVIGRSPQAECRVAHPSISRRHARLQPLPDGSWQITDLGSRNGVIVRSRRIDEAPLAPGDPIRLGDVVLTLEETAPPPPAKEAPAELESETQFLAGLSSYRGGEEEGVDVSISAEAEPEAAALPESLPSVDDLLDARLADASGDVSFESAPAESVSSDSLELDLDLPPEEAFEPATPPVVTASPTKDRDGLFRASERWILVAVGVLLITASLIVIFGRDPSPSDDPQVAAKPKSNEPAPSIDAEPSPTAPSPTPTSESTPTVVPPAPLLARLELVPHQTIERSWSAAIALYGRAPTPDETIRFHDEGPEAFFDRARTEPEHWRHAARHWLGAEQLPEALRLEEVPSDLAGWGAQVRDFAAEPRRDLWPVEPEAANAAWRVRYEGALSGALRIEGFFNALRSIWTAGAGRPIDDDVNRALREIAASGLPANALLQRFLILVTPAHPLFGERRASALLSADWERLLPRLPVDVAWPEGGVELGVAPPLYWATAIERRLPSFPTERPVVGPRGTLRIEVLAPFAVAPLFETPAKIPRLWRRLSESRLWICPPGERSAEDLFAIAGSTRRGEWGVSAENALPEEATAAWRVADGYLLPAFARLAARLGVPAKTAALRPEIATWWSEARGDRGTAAEPLFKAGGYRLVPGEWRSSAYRPVTRALLLAGAQLLESPGTDVVARVVLSETPREGVEGEWAEWWTALELIADRCPEHRFQLWFISPQGEGSQGVGLEWGPEIRTGWVVEEDRPAEEVHPRLIEEIEVAAPRQERPDEAAGGLGETRDEARLRSENAGEDRR